MGEKSQFFEGDLGGLAARPVSFNAEVSRIFLSFDVIFGPLNRGGAFLSLKGVLKYRKIIILKIFLLYDREKMVHY